MIASFARDAEPGVRHQPGDDGEMAQAGDGLRYEDGAEGATINRSLRGR